MREDVMFAELIQAITKTPPIKRQTPPCILEETWNVIGDMVALHRSTTLKQTHIRVLGLGMKDLINSNRRQ